MAAGCPIVATNISELRKFSSLISIARNSDEFDFYLKQLLSNEHSDLKNRLLSEAQKHTWSQRTTQMISYIQKCIGEKYEKRIYQEVNLSSL